jgi:hypothetical protein
MAEHRRRGARWHQACTATVLRRTRVRAQLDWSAYDSYGAGVPVSGGGFGKAVAVCIGNRQCQRDGLGVMCPSYRATADVAHSTQHRAATLRAALNGELGPAPFAGPELAAAMEPSCLLMLRDEYYALGAHADADRHAAGRPAGPLHPASGPVARATRRAASCESAKLITESGNELTMSSTKNPADKPFAPSCERNRDVILERLLAWLPASTSVLEIGSGTGQHAVHFAAALPHLRWQCSEREEALAGLRMWLDEAALPNTPPPLALDVGGAWPALRYDAVFTANTLHIMGWPDVEALFAALPSVMAPSARLAVYGPFRYGGRHTSDSNAAFDRSLREAAPHRGIRDFEAVDALARAAGLELVEDFAMPANNRCILWARAA